MLTLPPKFKQALGNGTRTSLYPLVRIYKGYQIDDTIPDDAESINLSIKETNIGGEAYNPLLLNSPSISSKADIINNKYTISSVSLSISNALYKGKIFSDDIPNLLNAVVQVYYAANGLDTLDDCLLVYTGTIRRYSQSAETLSLTLEDLTEQKLKTLIPKTTIDNKFVYDEETQGKPFPLVYGYVDKSPLILTKDNELIIEQSNTEIGGLWSNPSHIDKLNPYIRQTILYPNYISKNSHIYCYNNGYLPISETLPYNFGRKVFPSNEGATIYEYEDSTADTSAKVKIVGANIMSESMILGFMPDENKIGIPTRIYRPVEKVSFFAANHGPTDFELDNGLNYWYFGSCHKFFGFNNNEMLDATKSVYNFTNSSDEQDLDNLYSIGDTYYDADWDETNLNATFSWWKPTDLNQQSNTNNIDGMFEDLDKNYIAQNKVSTFPVQWIQNANYSSGLHLTAQNNASYSTGSFARLQFSSDIASYVCATKIFYKIDYFTPNNFETPYNTTIPYPVTFWAERELIERSTYDTQGMVWQLNFESIVNNENIWDENYDSFPDTWKTDCEVPNHQHSFESNETEFRYTNNNLGGDLYTNQIRTFNRTDAYDSINWGLPQLEDVGFMISTIANLKEFYTLQDILITDYTQEKFYGSIKGRVNNDVVMTKPYTILEDILKKELDYQKDFNFPSDDIDDDWINSFTLTEQKEAKNVINNLCKSSIYIPSFDSTGNFKFIDLKQNIEDYEQFEKINILDVINYSFSLTKIEDVKNQINVKYKKDYASNDYEEQTTYGIEDNTGNFVETLDELTQQLDIENIVYDIGYYGIKNEDAKLEIETDYIRDKDTARKLQRRLLMWYANQHLTAKIDLPLSYIHLEVGDYIRFDELMGGKLAFGFDYTQEFVKNGQLIYPVFFVTKASKSLSKVSLDLVQVHRGDFGMDNDDLGNYEIPNPYYDDIYQDIQDEEEAYFTFNWYLNNNDLETGVISAVTSTNLETGIEYEVLLTGSSATFTYNGITIEEGVHQHIDATDLVNATIIETGSEYGDNVQITPKMFFDNIETDEEMVFLEFELTIKSDIYDYGQMKHFMQSMYSLQFELGDVNQDGVINVQDIVATIGLTLSDDYNVNADMNQDGVINILDIVTIINVILN